MLGAASLLMAAGCPVYAQIQTINDASTSTAPPIGLQAPLPSPALVLPKGEKALKESPQPSAGKPLTIDEAVALALSTNRDLALAVENLSEAQGNTVSSKSVLGPTASAGYTLTRNNEAQTSNLNGQSIVTQKQSASQITASLSLPIDVTGVLHASTSQAQLQEIAARLDVNRVRNEIVLNVKTAFYNVLRDQALMTVAQDDLQNAVDRLSDAQLRLAAGTVARYDVLSAQTDVATARRSVVQSRTTLSVALATLNSTIGIAVDTPLQATTAGAMEVPAVERSLVSLPVPTSLGSADENNLTGQEGRQLGDAGAKRAAQAQEFVVTDPMPVASSVYFQDVLAEALKNRPEILRAETNVEAARKGIAIARQSILPSANLGYTYTLSPDATSQKRSGQATFTVSFPLYDAGAAHGKVRTANAAVAVAETNRRAQVDTVTLEVRQAYLNLQQALEEITAARQALAQADEAYRLARLRYSAGVTSQSGVSPIIELSNAQRSLTQAQSDYVNALYDYNNDRSALDKAAGRYSYTPVGPGYSGPNIAR